MLFPVSSISVNWAKYCCLNFFVLYLEMFLLLVWCIMAYSWLLIQSLLVISGTWSIIVCFSTFSFLDYICLFGCSMCQQMLICILSRLLHYVLGCSWSYIRSLHCDLPSELYLSFFSALFVSLLHGMKYLLTNIITFFLTRRFKTNVESLSLTSFPLYPMLSIASNVFDSSLLSIQQSIVKVGFPNCPQVPCS